MLSASFSKNFVYAVFPEALAVLSILPVLQGNRRTNDLKLSLSLNPFRKDRFGMHDCAAILDALGIGGGHPNAAGGKIAAESKTERLRLKAKAAEGIARGWKGGKSGPDDMKRM